MKISLKTIERLIKNYGNPKATVFRVVRHHHEPHMSLEYNTVEKAVGAAISNLDEKTAIDKDGYFVKINKADPYASMTIVNNIDHEDYINAWDDLNLPQDPGPYNAYEWEESELSSHYYNPSATKYLIRSTAEGWTKEFDDFEEAIWFAARNLDKVTYIDSESGKLCTKDNQFKPTEILNNIDHTKEFTGEINTDVA